MSNISGMVAMVALALVAGTVAHAQQVRYYESFSDGVPDYCGATRSESLSISPWHYKQGGQSLRWDWAAGEGLIIHHGIGDVNRSGGHRCRASFSVWLYMREPLADALVFEFREGDEVTGSFRFPLDFTGWRQARVYYHDFPEGKPTSEVDNIRISAPTDTPQGTVFIDFIKYNTLTYGGNSVIPEDVARWRAPVPDEQLFPRPEKVSDAELEGIRKLLGPAEGPGIDQARVDELLERVANLGIVRDEHGVRGPGVDAHYQYLAARGEHGIKDIAYWPDENGPDWLGVRTPAGMSSLANEVAAAYRASNDAGQRSRLADAFLLLSDHVYDQALQAGSGFRWSWWVGGAWADAIFCMRDLLHETGRLQGHLDFLLYTYGGGQIFADRDPTSNMDFYNLTVPSLLRQCLLQVEATEQVRWLNAFMAMLERSMLQPTSAFKIDGSAYHHSGHYHSYARGAFISLPVLIRDLNGTPWRLNADAHERVRRAMLAQRIYANRLDLPIALRGRSPFAPGYGAIRPSGFNSLDVLARCGTPDGTQEIDTEVASAYLRFVPGAADSEPYRTLGIEPEADPNGTFVMPYAGLLCHRRDNWLVSVKGQSKYVWGSEREAQRNCYGLFQGLGNLDVLAAGNPVNSEASGHQHHGWDWRKFEGITAPQLPIEAIDEAWRNRGLAYSPETFVGGMSHGGRQGVFAMVVNQPIPPDHALIGRKSWFFSDDHIICLGSNISCDEAQYPTLTTLCQRGLRADVEGDFPPTRVDGSEITTFPHDQEMDQANPHWFIDVQETGYYIPAGQKAILTRQRQASRDMFDTEDTEGNFLTAWIDHGTAPDNASYEYMLVVRATQEVLERFVANPPYRVVQCDETAHIVRHTTNGLWSSVFFVEQDVAEHMDNGESLPVKAVDRPSLVMAQQAQDSQLHLSVADPDLNLIDGVSQPQPLRVTLRGPWRLLEVTGIVNAWHLPDATDNIRIVSSNEAETVVEIVCQHGASYGLRLAR